MKKNIYIVLFLLCTINLYAQTFNVVIEDLKPTIENNRFPLIKYKNAPKIENKINTLLQIENLEHLPGVFTTSPFEQKTGDFMGSTSFDGYEQYNTPKNILSLSISGMGTGAYSEEFEIYYNFDLRNGKRITYNDFINEKENKNLTQKLNKRVKDKITDFLHSEEEYYQTENIKKEDKEYYNDQVEMYSYCLKNIENSSLDYYEFYFQKDSITFVRGRCSNHAMRALDDLGKFKLSFSFKEMQKYLSKEGVSLLNGDFNIPNTKSPEGKFYKGKINNKYPITVLISKVYSDNSLHIQYWYDKNKEPIEWNGTLRNNHFSLIEYDQYDETNNRWIIRAKIEADIIGDSIIGTWQDLKTNKIFKLKLTEY